MGAKRIFSKLMSLLDVLLTSLADGDVLTYDAASGKWKNAAASGGGGSGAPVVQTFSDANVTVNAATTVVEQTGTLTSTRNVSLPSAASCDPGHRVMVVDKSGTATSGLSHRLLLLPDGSDTISDVSLTSGYAVLDFSYGSMELETDGVSKWTVVGGNCQATGKFTGLNLDNLALNSALGISIANQLLIRTPASGVMRFMDQNGNGAAIEFVDMASLGSVTGGGRIGAIGGEVNVLDDSGNVTVISPHSKNAPDFLYETGPGVDRMEMHANVFLGTIRWSSRDRRETIDFLDMQARLGTPEQSVAAWTEVQTRMADNRFLCYLTESFADYLARTSINLWPKPTWAEMTPADRWNDAEADHVAVSTAAHDAWLARKDAAANRPFNEPEPTIYVARTAPDFLTNQ